MQSSIINFDSKHTKYWLSQNTPNHYGCGAGSPTFVKSWDSKGLKGSGSFIVILKTISPGSFYQIFCIFEDYFLCKRSFIIFFSDWVYSKTITITCLFRNTNGYIHLVLAYNPQKREQCPIILSPSVIISPRLDIDEGYHIREDSKKRRRTSFTKKILFRNTNLCLMKWPGGNFMVSYYIILIHKILWLLKHLANVIDPSLIFEEWKRTLWMNESCLGFCKSWLSTFLEKKFVIS